MELGDGRSAGFGYAEFTSASDMETCVRQMHRKPFEGRDIKVFRDSDEVELRECMQLAVSSQMKYFVIMVPWT